jgi:RNA polymerase primary sigma factor
LVNEREEKKRDMASDTNRALGSYLGEISRYDPLAPKDEIRLTQRIKRGDERAKKELIQSNLRFVVSVAKKFQGQGRPLEDLISDGNVGLIKAAERFDETRGFKFISYAVWWVRQSILQSLSEYSRMVRVPLNRQGDITRITKAAEELEQQLERQPRIEEIARHLEKQPAEVANSIQISRRHQSLDMTFSSDSENCLYDIIPDAGALDPDGGVMADSLKRDVESVLDSLNSREKDVIKMYFGIGRDAPLTLHEIGAEFNLTRERVRQIKEKALLRLKHKSRSAQLRPYI